MFRPKAVFKEVSIVAFVTKIIALLTIYYATDNDYVSQSDYRILHTALLGSYLFSYSLRTTFSPMIFFLTSKKLQVPY